MNWRSRIAAEDHVNLKYKSIIVTRRYKIEKAWTNAHKQRTYMGLTQVCRFLLQQLASLYLRARKASIFPWSLRQYLATFAVDGELRALGDALTKTERSPTVDGGWRLLSILQLLTNEGNRM
jgi:hypothetical protein